MTTAEPPVVLLTTGGPLPNIVINDLGRLWFPPTIWTYLWNGTAHGAW